MGGGGSVGWSEEGEAEARVESGVAGCSERRRGGFDVGFVVLADGVGPSAESRGVGGLEGEA